MRIPSEGEDECVDRTPPCHLEMHLSTFGQSVLQMAEVFYLNEESKTNPDFSALILYFSKLNKILLHSSSKSKCFEGSYSIQKVKLNN
jgi:hypothetical protein